MNETILTIFKDFVVDGVSIPVALIKYDGKASSYVIFSREDDTGAYSADDELQGWWTYYDFDVYSKHNYIAIAGAVRDKLEAAGWCGSQTPAISTCTKPTQASTMQHSILLMKGADDKWHRSD